MAFLRLLEGIRTPFFDGLFSLLTHLGDETAVLLAGLVLYWCLDKRFGMRLMFMAVMGGIVNGFLKALFRIPRPWLLDTDLTIVEAARAGATGYSFPSGHTQNACILYGGLAVWKKRPWLRAAALALVLVTAFSRMYLGVHSPPDVGASLLTGLGLLLLFSRLFAWAGEDIKRLSGIYLAGLGLALMYLGFVYLWPARGGGLPALDESAKKTASTLLGCLLGLGCSYMLERRCIGFETRARWWAQILKCLLGAALLLLVKEGLKGPLYGIFGEGYFADGLRYFLMCLTGGALWPLSFRFFGRFK